MAEWLIAPVLKTGMPSRASGVQILLPPLKIRRIFNPMPVPDPKKAEAQEQAQGATLGGVPKWLRGRFAKPLVGATPA